MSYVAARWIAAAWFAVFMVLVTAGASADTTQFVLVDSGVAPAPIVVAADAPPRTRAAAVELADYVEKISGQRPDIVDGEPRPLPVRAVWVGVQAVLKSVFPNKGYGRSHEWTLRQRLQLDSLDMTGGHSFGDWWDSYHEKYPEIFALQPDGSRSGFPSPHNAKLCMSNPKVWELWLDDVEAALARNPQLELFNASPNDGWASGHCVCERCRAWDHPDGEPRVFTWRNHKETRPALSDRDVTFANKLGELLRKKYPDKNYRVLMMSYGHSRPVPIKARPADNVVMSIVANFFGRAGLVDRGSTRGDTFRAQFDGWAKIVPSMLWRPNTGSPAGWQQGLPDLSIQQTIRDLKDVAAARCEGIFIDSVWEHWATQGPQYYVMGQSNN